jgi:hypothetical protein
MTKEEIMFTLKLLKWWTIGAVGLFTGQSTVVYLIFKIFGK